MPGSPPSSNDVPAVRIRSRASPRTACSTSRPINSGVGVVPAPSFLSGPMRSTLEPSSELAGRTSGVGQGVPADGGVQSKAVIRPKPGGARPS